MPQLDLGGAHVRPQMPPLQGTPTRALPQSLTPEQPLSTRVVLRAPGGRTKRPRHLTGGKKASGSACALDWERAMRQVNASTPASGRRTLWDLRWARSRAQRMRGNSPAPVPCGWSPRWPRPWVTSASAARTVGSQQSAGTWGEGRRNRQAGSGSARCTSSRFQPGQGAGPWRSGGGISVPPHWREAGGSSKELITLSTPPPPKRGPGLRLAIWGGTTLCPPKPCPR